MLLDAGREFASGFPKLGGHLLKVLHFVSTVFRCAEHPQDDLKTVIHDRLMTVDAQPPADCLARKTAEAIANKSKSPPLNPASFSLFVRVAQKNPGLRSRP